MVKTVLSSPERRAISMLSMFNLLWCHTTWLLVTPSTFHTRTDKPIALIGGGGGYGGGTPAPLQEIISNFNLGRHGSPVASPVKNKLLLPVMELEVLSFKLVFWLSTQGEKSSGTWLMHTLVHWVDQLNTEQRINYWFSIWEYFWSTSKSKDCVEELVVHSSCIPHELQQEYCVARGERWLLSPPHPGLQKLYSWTQYTQNKHRWSAPKALSLDTIHRTNTKGL